MVLVFDLILDAAYPFSLIELCAKDRTNRKKGL